MNSRLILALFLAGMALVTSGALVMAWFSPSADQYYNWNITQDNSLAELENRIDDNRLKINEVIEYVSNTCGR